jgi:glucan phosphoethanolaminetransferase (alkaline phosphatase superfamily)
MVANLKSISKLILYFSLLNAPNILFVLTGNSQFISSTLKQIYFIGFSFTILVFLISLTNSKTFSIIISLLMSFELLVILLIGETFSTQLVNSILNSESTEIFELIKSNQFNISVSILYFFILIFLNKHLFKTKKIFFTIKQRQIAFMTTVILISINIIRINQKINEDIQLETNNNIQKVNYSNEFYKGIRVRFSTVAPLSFLNSIYEFGIFKQNERSLINQSRNQKYASTRSKNDQIDIILIIGESSRKDNYQLYGYNRETNPLLSNQKNIIVFDNYYANSNITLLSVPLILSSAEPISFNKNFSEKGLVEVFNEVYFDTYWIKTQRYHKEANLYRFENPAKFKIDLVKENIFSNVKDELITESLKKIKLSSEKSNFIVIHSIGSHFNYEERYSDSFSKFKPDKVDGFNIIDVHNPDYTDILWNAYDNSILATDHLINSIIEHFDNEKRNSIVIFTSDHGENLFDGEGKFNLHGKKSPTKYEIEVPLIIWYSNEFIKNYPEKVSNLKMNIYKNKTHSIIFHSLLDLADIKTNYKNGKLSILNKNFEQNELNLISPDHEIINIHDILNN